jgi:tetratricopeptide (TPR) repeat protein
MSSTWFTLGKWALLAAILGWVLFRAMRRSEDEHLLLKWGVSVVLFPVAVWLMLMGNPFLGVPLAALVGVIIGVIWAPNVASAIARPMTSLFDGGADDEELRPLYSHAVASRKRGRTQEAIAAIRGQLELFPEDFEGQLMLAEIQAEDCRDLAAAQAAVDEIAGQRAHTPGRIAHALDRMAAWHLKLAQDVPAAHRCLQRICSQFPETELAQVAAQRAAHLFLPDRADAAAAARPIPVIHHEERVGLEPGFKGFSVAPGPDPALLAEQHLRHLDAFPSDVETREQLAHLYADAFGRLDLAAGQMEHLIKQPHQPARQVVHWLNRLVDLQVRYGTDPEPARATLARLIEMFPGSAAAENAQQRRVRLNLEFRGKQKSQAVKLGSYEENLGLRRSWPTAPPGAT